MYFMYDGYMLTVFHTPFGETDIAHFANANPGIIYFYADLVT